MSDIENEGAMRKPSICLVDDDDMMLSLFSRVLKRTGCDVIIAKGPDAATDVLANSRVDVMISDLRMPDVTDGEQLLKHAQTQYPGLAVWMMSSEFCAEMRDHLLRSGAAQCIEKPFKADNIAQLIDQLGIPNLVREPATSR